MALVRALSVTSCQSTRGEVADVRMALTRVCAIRNMSVNKVETLAASMSPAASASASKPRSGAATPGEAGWVPLT